MRAHAPRTRPCIRGMRRRRRGIRGAISRMGARSSWMRGRIPRVRACIHRIPGAHPPDGSMQLVDAGVHPVDTHTHPADTHTHPVDTHAPPVDRHTRLADADAHVWITRTHAGRAHAYPVEARPHPVDAPAYPARERPHPQEARPDDAQSSVSSEQSGARRARDRAMPRPACSHVARATIHPAHGRVPRADGPTHAIFASSATLDAQNHPVPARLQARNARC